MVKYCLAPRLLRGGPCVARACCNYEYRSSLHGSCGCEDSVRTIAPVMSWPYSVRYKNENDLDLTAAKLAPVRVDDLEVPVADVGAADALAQRVRTSLWQDLGSYRFWDVVSQWAQDQCLHEHPWPGCSRVAWSTMGFGSRASSLLRAVQPSLGCSASRWLPMCPMRVGFRSVGCGSADRTGEPHVRRQKRALRQPIHEVLPANEFAKKAFIRQSALSHLMAVAERAAVPDRRIRKTARRLRAAGNAQVLLWRTVIKLQHIAGTLRAFTHICKKLSARGLLLG